ncbi:hypothetical protein CRE_14396 [Caenorhabditis remanei]|uniref:Sdz-33 F-box domain-containing protein n=1 Tax=Caenorhabditis remanei TaxID=31234 RepID=E3NPD3_CAERE|nr:hypothetical protein CRE_14396 [Caenorhabditis remanei]
MSSTPFPLFSLPYLPLKQVFDNFGPHGIIIFSLCSQKSRNMAISYRGPSKDIKIEIHFVEMDENGYLKTYWEDRMVGMSILGDYIRQVFNQDIHKLLLGQEHKENDHRRAVGWLMASQNEQVKHLCCNFEPKTDKDLDDILEACNYTERLQLLVKPSENYRPTKMPNFNVIHLSLYPSFWIHLDHLLTMNARTIVLTDSKLSSGGINVFLKHWMNGGCFKLKYIVIFMDSSMDPINYQVVMNGIQCINRNRELKRSYVNDENRPWTVRGGVDIQRSIDGVTATVLDRSHELNRFHLVVWPDFAGNSHLP